MKHKQLIIQALKKEALLFSTLNKWGLKAEEDSALDLSYFEEISALWGMPSEKKLKEAKIDEDKFLSDYVSCVYGKITAEDFVTNWESKLDKVKKEYDPSKHKELLKKFLEKERRLWLVVKDMGSSSKLSALVSDWDMADALFGKNSEKFHQDLFNFVEGSGDISNLV